MANAADLASESSTSLKGLLRVGVLSIVGTHFVVPMLPNLLTLHPELSVQLVRVSSGEDFYSQQVDCALLAGQPGGLGPRRKGVAARPDGGGRSPGVHLPLRRPGTAGGPAGAPLHNTGSVRWPGATLAVQAQGRPAEPVNLRIRGRIRTDDMEQAMAAALAGLGIAQVPHLPLQHAIAADRLVVLMPEHENDGCVVVDRLPCAPGIAQAGAGVRGLPAQSTPRPPVGRHAAGAHADLTASWFLPRRGACLCERRADALRCAAQQGIQERRIRLAQAA